MRFMTGILIAACLLAGLAGTALAAEPEVPPALVLLDGDFLERPLPAGYTWTVPAETPGEASTTEACGPSPTDPSVYGESGRTFLAEERTCTLRWEGRAPEEVLVYVWQYEVLEDPEHPEDYLENGEIVARPDCGTVTLKPGRIYSFRAAWTASGEDGKAFGTAEYYLAVEKVIIDDDPFLFRTGGWTPAADPAITEERQAVFDKGASVLTGMTWVPVAYLGSQVAAGTNHAFLCRAETAYPGMDMPAEPAYAMVYLYEDPEGNVSVLNIADFDVGSLCSYGAGAE